MTHALAMTPFSDKNYNKLSICKHFNVYTYHFLRRINTLGGVFRHFCKDDSFCGSYFHAIPHGSFHRVPSENVLLIKERIGCQWANSLQVDPYWQGMQSTFERVAFLASVSTPLLENRSTTYNIARWTCYYTQNILCIEISCFLCTCVSSRKFRRSQILSAFSKSQRYNPDSIGHCPFNMRRTGSKIHRETNRQSEAFCRSPILRRSIYGRYIGKLILKKKKK